MIDLDLETYLAFAIFALLFIACPLAYFLGKDLGPKP